MIQLKNQINMNKTGLIGKYVTVNDYCWLHYNTEKGQSQSGDYAYLEAYAKDRSEKILNGETYVKVKIKGIIWKYTSFAFNCTIMSEGNTELYNIQITEPERLTLIEK